MIRYNLATLLTVAAFVSPNGASSKPDVVDHGIRHRSSAVMASIMSDEYTTYRRGRGDSSRVGQYLPINITDRTA